MLLNRLQEQGIRLTRQRRIVCEVLEEAAGHLDAAQILEQARQRDERIDRATVYRIIDLLKQQGLLEELDLLHLNGKEHYYEIKNERQHVHLGCPGCGRIQEYKTGLLEELSAEIKKKTGFSPVSMRIEVAAYCPRCGKGR